MSLSKNTIISVIYFLVISGLSFWFWNIQESIVSGAIDRGLIIQSVIIFIAIIALVSVNLMISSRVVGFLMAGALPLAFLAVVGFNDQIFLVVSGASFALGIIAYFSAKREKHRKLNLSISSAKGGVSIYFFAGLLLLTALFYQNSFSKGELKLNESQVRSLMPYIEGQIKSQVPFYSEGMTTDQFLVMSALAQGTISMDAVKLSSATQKELQKKIAVDPKKSVESVMQDPEVQMIIINDIIKNNPKKIAELRKDFQESMGVTLEENQSITSLMTAMINVYLDKIISSFDGKKYLPIALALTFLFSFKALSFLFVDVAIIIGGFIFLILKAGGVLKINKISVMQETLE